MAKIKLMNEKLANMIAAGEVVDRPSSVIKELVENSIDASSTKITIEVVDFGMKQIKVTDNGSGMDKADIHSAFYRHATSKISNEFELAHINTLGFRGEAIPAISAVSKITIKSKEENNDGFYVTYHAGKLFDSGITAMNKGTIVEVNELFYNTPARYKYIKSDLVEKNAIIDTFDHLALSNPNISFSLWMDDKMIKSTYGNGDYIALIDAIYGKNMAKDLTFFKDSFQKIEIAGYLLNPSITRSRKKDISIFVNGRYIKNYGLIQAVIDGYHGYLMTNRYPIAIINVNIDTSLIDVNVHPQKMEIKFVNDYMLSLQLKEFIIKSFNTSKQQITSPLIPNVEKLKVDELFVNSTVDEKRNEHNYIFEKRDVLPLVIEEKREIIYETNNDKKIENNLKKLPFLEYVGTFAKTYLLFQNNLGLYLVDQHAAAERIRYEYYYEKIGTPKFAIKQQLIPIKMPLTFQEKEIISENLDKFLSIGIEFDNNLEVTGMPTWLKDEDIEVVVMAITSMLLETNNFDLKAIRDDLAKDISCKGAIKANHQLSINEINALVLGLNNCNNPYNCPHGRPVLIKIEHKDIEKMFKRIV